MLNNIINFKEIKEKDMLSKINNAQTNNEKCIFRAELNRFNLFLLKKNQRPRRINYYFPIVNQKNNKNIL